MEVSGTGGCCQGESGATLLLISLQHMLKHHAWHKSRHWWECIVNGSWILAMDPEERDDQFIQEFRVSYKTFNDLCVQLGPYIERNDTNKREAITVPHRVAIALYRIAHGATYTQLAVPLACGASTAQGICEEIYQVMEEHLWPEHIVWPQGRDLHDIINAAFELLIVSQLVFHAGHSYHKLLEQLPPGIGLLLSVFACLFALKQVGSSFPHAQSFQLGLLCP